MYTFNLTGKLGIYCRLMGNPGGLNWSTPVGVEPGSAMRYSSLNCVPAGAVIEGIVMSGYAAQDQKGPSWLTVSALAAGAHADGTLVGVFTMSMPKPASSYPPKAFPILYAFGPLDKAGNIEIHPVRASPPPSPGTINPRAPPASRLPAPERRQLLATPPAPGARWRGHGMSVAGRVRLVLGVQWERLHRVQAVPRGARCP